MAEKSLTGSRGRGMKRGAERRENMRKARVYDKTRKSQQGITRFLRARDAALQDWKKKGVTYDPETGRVVEVKT